MVCHIYLVSPSSGMSDLMVNPNQAGDRNCEYFGMERTLEDTWSDLLLKAEHS